MKVPIAKSEAMVTSIEGLLEHRQAGDSLPLGELHTLVGRVIAVKDAIPGVRAFSRALLTCITASYTANSQVVHMSREAW